MFSVSLYSGQSEKTNVSQLYTVDCKCFMLKYEIDDKKYHLSFNIVWQAKEWSS